MKEARSVKRNQALDQTQVFGLDPVEKRGRDRVPVAELRADVRQIDSGDEAHAPRFKLDLVAQAAQKTPNQRLFLRQTAVLHHVMKGRDQNRDDLKRPRTAAPALQVRNIFEKYHLELERVL